jgi:hypothetical protein
MRRSGVRIPLPPVKFLARKLDEGNEIANAKVGWFDLDGGLIHVQNDPKSGFVLKDRENRSIPLSKPFQEFLAPLLEVEERRSTS